MTPNIDEAVALAEARAVIEKYGADADKPSVRLAAALLVLADRVAKMEAVVAGAVESYAHLGALDLRVGEVVDEDNVRLWRAHESAIGEPLRAYRKDGRRV